jgi:hypothetical protein
LPVVLRFLVAPQPSECRLSRIMLTYSMLTLGDVTRRVDCSFIDRACTPLHTPVPAQSLSSVVPVCTWCAHTGVECRELRQPRGASYYVSYCFFCVGFSRVGVHQPPMPSPSRCRSHGSETGVSSTPPPRLGSPATVQLQKHRVYSSSPSLAIAPARLFDKAPERSPLSVMVPLSPARRLDRSEHVWSPLTSRALEQFGSARAARNLERSPSDDPLLSRAAIFLLRRELARAWSAWRAAATEMRRRRGLRLGAFKRMLSLQRSRAWASWIAAAAERASFLQRVRRGVGLLAHRSLALSVAVWKAAKARPSRAMQCFLRRDLSRSFVGWHTTAVQLMAKQMLMQRSLGHMHNRRLHAALGAWACAARIACIAYQMLERAILAIVHSRARAALNAWVAAVCSWRTQQQSLAASVGCFRQNGLRRAVNQWTWDCAMSRKLSSAIVTLAHMHARIAYNTWSAKAHHRRGVRVTLLQLLSSLRHSGLRRAMNKWTKMVSSQLRLRRAALVAMFRQRHQAWYHWKCLVSAQREKQIRMRASLSAWQHGRLCTALRQWVASAMEASMAREILHRSMSAMSHRQVRTGFNTWVRATTEWRALWSRQCASMRRLSQQGLWCAINQWASTVRAAHGILRQLESAVLALAARSLRSAFNTCTSSTQACARVRRAMLASVTAMRHSGLRRAMNLWAVTARDATNDYRLIAGFAARAIQPMKAKAFATWRDRAQRMKLQALKADNTAIVLAMTRSAAAAAKEAAQAFEKLERAAYKWTAATEFSISSAIVVVEPPPSMVTVHSNAAAAKADALMVACWSSDLGSAWRKMGSDCECQCDARN